VIKIKCPNCNREMKYELKDWYAYPFTTGDELDYPSYYRKEKYLCKECGISCIDSKWKIPKKYERPTNKQINTIKFINNELRMDIQPLTKKQCINDIGKYFNEAKLCTMFKRI
jgi:hypothetical protein